MSLAIGFLADDLTGATDVLAQAHAQGLDAVLVLDPAELTPELVSAADVAGIASPIRSLEGGALETAVAAGLTALAGSTPAVLLYKVCSTFDSSPTTGSIGRAIELLGETFPDHGAVPVVPAQPAFGRYTAFSQHFGTHDGQVHRLDRHPVMSVHPSTPMHEADLREVLAAQLAEHVAVPGLHLSAQADGTFAERWTELRSGPAPAFVVDAVDEEDLDRVAEAVVADPVDGPSLVVGSGGIMGALARRTARATAADRGASTGSADGPVLVVSASASTVTAGQIDDAVEHGWHPVHVEPQDTEPDRVTTEEVLRSLAAGLDVVAHTAHGPDDPRLTRTPRPGVEEVGATIGGLVARAVADGLTRDVVICGGDSSGLALAALGVRELRVVAPLVTAGPICRADDASAVAGCRLLLKGGQVGPPDLFRRFAARTSPASTPHPQEDR